MAGSEVEPEWALVANVVNERLFGPNGDVRSGTKHFVPGAKVYYHYGYWGMGGEQIMVTGHHRGSKKLVSVVMARRHLHNWRAKLVYKPAILKRLDLHWNEIAKRSGRDSAEVTAKELAESFNAALHFSTHERTKDFVDQLIEGWKLEGYNDFHRLLQFQGDRWIVLYEGVVAVGIGVSDFSRKHVSWIRPGFHGGWQWNLKPALERTLPHSPGLPRIAYETGMSPEALSDLANLMSEQFDALHEAVFDSSGSEGWVDHLETFIRPLVHSAIIGWPDGLSGHEEDVLAGWLGGRTASETAKRLGVTIDLITEGFEILRGALFDLSGAAFRLMKDNRSYDVDEKITVAEILERHRLRYGVNSGLAYSLLFTIFHQEFGRVKFGRVAASSLATEFQNQNRNGDRDAFREFALDRVREWVKRGQVHPVNPSEEGNDWGTWPSGRNSPSVGYLIDHSPDEDDS